MTATSSRTTPPQSWADFFDTEKFPGKRALRKGPRQALEFALMADGVPLDQIYATLATPEGVDRAFKKLDSIRTTRLVGGRRSAAAALGSGEVVMTSAYNGRITAANKTDKQELQDRLGRPASSTRSTAGSSSKNSDLKDEAVDRSWPT